MMIRFCSCSDSSIMVHHCIHILAHKKTKNKSIKDPKLYPISTTTDLLGPTKYQQDIAGHPQMAPIVSVFLEPTRAPLWESKGSPQCHVSTRK